MIWNTLLKALIFKAFLTFVCAATWAASLELGQVRSNRRGWSDLVRSGDSAETTEVATPADEEIEVTEEVVENEIPAFHVNNGVAEIDRSARVKRVRSSSKRGSGLILIGGRKKAPTLRDGYLAVASPPALRFSDVDPAYARPPSPALPEFNFASSEYMPYLIEEALSDDALSEAAMISQLVIDLPEHEVVSGKINLRRNQQAEGIEHFSLGEQSATILRPEEVLIYFESDTSTGRSGALVPFSPATPTNPPPVRSKATFTKE